ncbi:238_t:CDS:2, partial [Rhizophagus irregularis]
ESSAAAAQRQNTDQSPAKKAKIKQNTKSRTSWVWNYFEINNDNAESIFAQCKVIEDGEMECRGKLKQVKITTMVKSANPGAYSNKVQARYHQEVLDYILEDIQPISCVKKSGFNKLLNFFDSCVTLPSDHKIHEMLAKSYNYTYRELHDLIKKEAKSVALTADCWSSRSRHPYIGATATCEKVKVKMEKYFRDWNLEPKFITITCDNGSNMVGAIDRLLKLRLAIATVKNQLDVSSLSTDIDDRRRLNSIMLTNEEWSFMKSLLNILQPVEEVTRKLSGSNYVTLSLVYPTLALLLK